MQHAHHYSLPRVLQLLCLIWLEAGVFLVLADRDVLAAPQPVTGSTVLASDSHHSIPGKPCYQRKKTQGDEEFSGQARIWLVKHCSSPSNLQATVVGAAKIDLTWNPPTDVPTSSYRVERCQGASCTNFAEIAQPTDPLYHDTGLTPETTYRYRVRAVHTGTGALSAYSAIASATTPADTTPPEAPANLAATPHATLFRVTVSWPAATDDVGVTGYLLERCEGVGCSSFAQIATPTALSYVDTPLRPNRTYSYRVRARDAAGNISAYSVSAGTTTVPDTTPPSVPSSPTSTVTGLTTLTVAWVAATDDDLVGSYRIERCQGISCSSFAEINSQGAGSLTFENTNLTKATSYSYRIRAVDDAGNIGPYSSVATAMTAVFLLSINDGGVMTVSYGGTGDGVFYLLSPNGTPWRVTASSATGALTVTDGVSGTPIGLALMSSNGKIWDASITDAGVLYLMETSISLNDYLTRAAVVANHVNGIANIAVADTSPPSTPSDSAAATPGLSQIPLSWTASTDNSYVAGYKVERCQGVNCTNFTEIATLGSTATSFMDTGLPLDTSYSYRIRSIDGAGHLSSYSQVITAATAANRLSIDNAGLVTVSYGGPGDEVFYLQSPNGTSWRVTASGATGTMTAIDGPSGSPIGRALTAPNGKAWDMSITNAGVLVVTEQP